MTVERVPARRIVRPNRERARPCELQEFEARQADGLTDEVLNEDELQALERRARDLWPTRGNG